MLRVVYLLLKYFLLALLLVLTFRLFGRAASPARASMGQEQEYNALFTVRAKGSGELLKDASVVLANGKEATTDVNGECTIALTPGDYTGRVLHRDFLEKHDLSFTVTDHDLSLEVELTVHPEGRYEVNFRVLDRGNSQPIPGVNVNFGPIIRSTNGEGWVSFRGNPGDYLLTVNHAGYLPYSETISVGAAPLTKDLLLTVDAGITQVQYHVFDVHSKANIAGAKLYSESRQLLGTTDADGRVTLELLPGLHTVQVEADGFSPVKVRVNVDLSGQALQLDVPMPPIEVVKYYFHIKVRDAVSGKSLPGAVATIVNPRQQKTTSQAGIATFSLPSGNYQYQVEHPDYKASDLLSISIVDRLQSVEVKLTPILYTPIESVRTTPSARLSPNPCRGTLHVESAQSVAQFSILSLMGYLIQKAPVAPSRQHFTIDTHQLTPGVYLLRLSFSDGEGALLRFRVE